MADASEYGRVNYQVTFYPDYIKDTTKTTEAQRIDITQNVKSIVLNTSLFEYATCLVQIAADRELENKLQLTTKCAAQITLGKLIGSVPGWWALSNVERIYNEDTGISEYILEFVTYEIAYSPRFQRAFYTDYYTNLSQLFQITNNNNGMPSPEPALDLLEVNPGIYGNPWLKGQTFWEYVQEANNYTAHPSDAAPYLTFQKLNRAGRPQWIVQNMYSPKTPYVRITVVNINRLAPGEASSVKYGVTSDSLEAIIAGTDFQDGTYISNAEILKLKDTLFVSPQEAGFFTVASVNEKVYPEIIKSIEVDYLNYNQVGQDSSGRGPISQKILKKLLTSGQASITCYFDDPGAVQPGHFVRVAEPGSTGALGTYIVLSTTVNTSNRTGFTTIQMLDVRFLNEFINYTNQSNNPGGLATNLRKDDTGA